MLSLSWLGLGQVAASLWLLLLLVGASWLLARVLAWSYSFYDTCCCLRCFPQPPKQSWFWGHLGLVSVGGRTGLGHWVDALSQGWGTGTWGGAGVWDSREGLQRAKFPGVPTNLPGATVQGPLPPWPMFAGLRQTHRLSGLWLPHRNQF